MTKLPYRLIRFDQSGRYAGYIVSPRRSDVEGYTYFAVDAPPSNPVLDGDGWREMTEQEIADITEQKEAERIAGLAAEHGTMVGQLVAALGAFGIALPTSLPECMPVMYAACKADPTLNADSQLAQVLYSQLLTVMTDDDIYHVSLILNQ